MEELKRYSIHLIAVSEGKESIVCSIPCPRWRKYIDLMRWRGCESEIPYGLRLDRVKYGDFFLRVRLFTSKGERAPQQPQIIARLQKLSRNRELESTKELPLYTPEHFDFSGEKIELIPRRDFTLSYDEYRISVSPQF
jgi:hypothetical protein